MTLWKRNNRTKFGNWSRVGKKPAKQRSNQKLVDQTESCGEKKWIKKNVSYGRGPWAATRSELGCVVAGEYAHMQLHLCELQVLELTAPFAWAVCEPVSWTNGSYRYVCSHPCLPLTQNYPIPSRLSTKSENLGSAVLWDWYVSCWFILKFPPSLSYDPEQSCFVFPRTHRVETDYISIYNADTAYGYDEWRYWKEFQHYALHTWYGRKANTRKMRLKESINQSIEKSFSSAFLQERNSWASGSGCYQFLDSKFLFLRSDPSSTNIKQWQRIQELILSIISLVVTDNWQACNTFYKLTNTLHIRDMKLSATKSLKLALAFSLESI